VDSSGVPHSLQKRPSAAAPQPGQLRASGVPQEEQNFAWSALPAWHAPQKRIATPGQTTVERAYGATAGGRDELAESARGYAGKYPRG